MSVAVVIPWREGCPHRERALDWVTARYERLGWPVVLGLHEDGPWRKGVAVADGVAHTDAEVLVVADADVWCDATPEAVERMRTWAIPHWQVRRLDQAATDAVLAGAEPGGGLAERPYPGHVGGGIVVLPRSLWDEVPIDPRFAGWGGEDDAWGHALRIIAGGPLRLREPLWHLWHPPQDRLTRKVGSEASRDLCRRYLGTVSAQGIRDLVREAVTWPAPA